MIFDLDDTLVETSKCLTPAALIRALDAVQAAGLKLEEGAAEQLLELNKQALTSQDALRAFFRLYPEQLDLLELGLKVLALPLPECVPLEPVPGALELLNAWKSEHILTLVTRGDEGLQLEKMEKAGIQQERFSKLIVSRGPSKRGAYQTILDTFDVLPSEVLVCGDRVPFDLTPGRELGITTVHFRNGRGLCHAEPSEDVDETIHGLTELNEVLAHYEV